MVKNRNWENRVEKAEARKVAAKQRKQRRDNKGAFKAMVQELLALMDRHADSLFQKEKHLHLWIDSLPSDSPPLLDMYCSSEEKKRGKGRRRSSSFNEQRSSSGKKKSRPRSSSNVGEMEESSPLRLCQDHFFSGKCEESHRKSGCRNVHYDTSRYETLGSVVKDAVATKSAQDAAASWMYDSMINIFEESGMDMIYYFSLQLKASSSDDNSEVNRKVSDVVSKALLEKSCSLGSLVYVAVNDILLFDRHQGGLLLSEIEFAENALGESYRRQRSQSMESQGGVAENGESNGDHQGHPLVLLPGPLLEHILTFLPDQSVPIMCMVCQVWYEEIGATSPALWKDLLKRRNWPPPISSSLENGVRAESERDAYRNAFLMHYSITRNMRAIKAGTCALVTRRAMEENEMVMQAFSTRRGAPQPPNGCVEVKIWSPKRVLVAYSHDCTLRLFEAVEKSDSGTNSCPRGCREVVCVRAAPFKNTRRRSCRLLGMDVDEDMIGCLCGSITETKDTFFLVVISREDFLCAGGTDLDEGTIHVIDIAEAVLNWLLSCEEVDHSLLQLSDFLAEADSSDVEVLVSESIVACGYGRFLVEVAISIPNHELLLGTEPEMVLLDRKLVLFSAAAGAIVWMGHSNPTESFQPRHEDLKLACLRQPRTRGGSRAACSLAIVSSTSPMILTLEIEPSGHVDVPQTLEASELVRSEVLDGGWEMSNVCQRAVVVTSSDIVVADNLSREIENVMTDRKSVLSFYPRTIVVDSGTLYSTLILEGMCEAVRMERIGDDHVVVLCRVYSINVGGESNEEQEAAYAVVLHVPSRREIQRLCLLEDPASCFARCYSYDIPIFLAASGDTIGVGVFWKGMILTGDDVRSVGHYSYRDRVEDEKERNNSAKKKKKKRQPNRGSKKDAYARGMSLSG